MAELAQFASTTATRVRHLLNIDARRQFERDAAFIAAVGICFFLASALVTFQPFEQWAYSSAGMTGVRSHNLCGPTGNILAGALFFYMGLTAFTLPALILQLS